MGIKVSILVKVLNLLFVDDILIMSRASLVEWEKIQDILHVFYRASGLVINVQNSIFLYAGVSSEILQSLKYLLQISFKELDVGFKYLGYLMKPNCYKLEDWQWLIDKFETKINHWCNKWLSLGGCFVLIKSVLESLLVYRMTLAYISVLVLHKLCKLSISFLWLGNKKSVVIIYATGIP
jgi:hypothetical protein